MKRPRISIWLIALFFPALGFSQFSVNGAFQSSVYSFENPSDLQQANFYQGVYLKFQHASLSNTYLNTGFRVAKTGDDSWEERIYNTYVDWKSQSKVWHLRLGRQFTYYGAITGTLDGALLDMRFMDNRLNIKLFGGFDAPYDRKLSVTGGDSTAIGALLSYNLFPATKVDVSYFQRKRNDEVAWEQASFAVNGREFNDLYYQLQYDHDLLGEQFQGIRGRLTYYMDKWSFTGEYANQRPRILEDSFFRIFDIKAYTQVRGGLTYQLSNYQLGLQYIFTNYSSEQGNQVIVTAANNWGLLGVIYQTGYAGDNMGVYGDIRYGLLPNLTVKLYSSYYTYERQTTVISEDATSFAAGFEYKPFSSIILSAEAQESMNSYYDNDFRGLFRLNYLLNFKSE